MKVSKEGDGMRRHHFAVVTVVRNDLTGLKKTRASLESETYKKWTHIIVDGGSTDGTLEYLKSLSDENTLYISEPDSGIYDAMNKAWRMAHPDSFVYFLNARDCFADELSLSMANQGLNFESDPVWGCTTHEEIAEDGYGWVCKLVSPPSVPNQLYAFGYRSHQAVVMRASLIEKLGGFNEKYRIAADWDLIARALFETTPTTWVHPLGRFELGGMSSSRLLEAHMELREIRKIYLWKKFSDKFLDDVWCAIFLRALGFKNYLSKPLAVIYPASPKRKVKKDRKHRERQILVWLGRNGIRLTLQHREKPRKFNDAFRGRYEIISYLHKKLSISAYSKME